MKRAFSVLVLLAIMLTACYARANDEWNEYMTRLSTGPVSERARIAMVPSSPPQTQEQLNALRYHKKLLQQDLKEVRKDIARHNYPEGSSALSQTESAYEMKIQKINIYLKRK